MSKQSQQISCPECAADITLEDGVKKGEVITCPDCGSDLEILNLNPLKIKKAPEAQEDWGQ